MNITGAIAHRLISMLTAEKDGDKLANNDEKIVLGSWHYMMLKLRNRLPRLKAGLMMETVCYGKKHLQKPISLIWKHSKKN